MTPVEWFNVTKNLFRKRWRSNITFSKYQTLLIVYIEMVKYFSPDFFVRISCCRIMINVVIKYNQWYRYHFSVSGWLQLFWGKVHSFLFKKVFSLNLDQPAQSIFQTRLSQQTFKSNSNLSRYHEHGLE